MLQGRLRLCLRAVEHCVEQHVAAGSQVLGLCFLDLVVADPADAWHENHRGRGDARHVDGVVTGTADDVLVRVALRLGCAAHSGDEIGMERGRREVPELLDLDIEADRRGYPLASLPQVAVYQVVLHRLAHRAAAASASARHAPPGR